ncbi:MAG: penicillin-binding protein 2 [Candidatus Moranbacteria bacterium RIFOXYA12_FULL_35_19]|nr:MAG: penicillin-binding protein 2 [Candidatus Moranbacteria bacterium RIFOXYC12_FULL_36_13]OGI36218.1 MAG: penicillin-binding protein 2 [Candidatus Moranbacteria bacterium RIFOXYA12_FULL_35_19]
MFRKFFNQKRIDKGVEIEDSIMTITEKEEAIIESPFERRGLYFLWLAILGAIVLLAGRVVYLNFYQGNYYNEISKNNRIRSIVIKAPRGNIFDKYGKLLAGNTPSIDAVVVPADLPKNEGEKKIIAQKLAQILEMNSGNIEIMLFSQDPKSLNPVLLKENITRDQALILAEREAEYPGIKLEKTAIRTYDSGPIFSSLLGYDGKITQKELQENPDYLMTDYIGKSGLEKKYEKNLRGIYGATQMEVDSLGNAKRTLGIINPVAGNDLILNINGELQKVIFDSLSGILQKTETKEGAVVAIDPRTGGVLSLVNLPSYDNNLFARGISNEEYKKLIADPNLPLFNRCIAGNYPPGSTLKPAVAAAALSEKTISESTIINGLGGALYVGSYRFGDWKAHEPSDVRRAIAESNDIFFYTIGGGYGNIAGLGMSRMKKYENLFGFGELTGIDIPGEAKGFIPSEQWKLDEIGERWYIGDSYHAAIGQGFVTATPLQLANFTASLANGGTLYSPRIANRIKKNDGTEEIISSKIINSNFISPEVMKVVREGMRMTVESGTAQSLKSLPVAVAGKTGTAQFGTEGKTHSWFIAFAPYENPEIAIAVIVPGGGEGNSGALPVAREALEWYFNH